MKYFSCQIQTLDFSRKAPANLQEHLQPNTKYINSAGALDNITHHVLTNAPKVTAVSFRGERVAHRSGPFFNPLVRTGRINRILWFYLTRFVNLPSSQKNVVIWHKNWTAKTIDGKGPENCRHFTVNNSKQLCRRCKNSLCAAAGRDGEASGGVGQAQSIQMEDDNEKVVTTAIVRWGSGLVWVPSAIFTNLVNFFNRFVLGRTPRFSIGYKYNQLYEPSGLLLGPSMIHCL